MTRTASDRPGRPAACVLATLVLTAAATAIPAAARAQSVALQIRPQLGDTLHMRLDQRVEMSGTTKLRGSDSTAAVVTTLLVLSRAIVERREHGGTVVLASTDSVAVWSSGSDSSIIAAEARRVLQGKRVRLRIAPDGATEMIDGPGGDPDLHAVFAQMPATLPRGDVKVGGTWSRAMVLPIAGDVAARTTGAGMLKATFRLDSLARSGDVAYLSLVGTLARAPSAAKDATGTTVATQGSLVGSMVVDRRRGWITDARLTYTIRSLVTPPVGGASNALRFRMKITQWMRAIE